MGTHIRNVLVNLPLVAPESEFLAVVRSADQKDVPAGVKPILYDRGDDDRLGDIRFPAFLKSLKADVHHLPLNSVPLFMPKPYVVTIHDMASLLFPTSTGFENNWNAYRFRRGLLRADHIIGLSKEVQGATTAEAAATLMGQIASLCAQLVSGADANGEWRLFVVDDASIDSGSIAGGWSLEITTSGGTGSWVTFNSPSTTVIMPVWVTSRPSSAAAKESISPSFASGR